MSDAPGKYAFQAMGMTTSGNVGEILWLFIKKVSTIAYEHSNYEVDERLFAQTWLTRLSCCAAQQNAQHAIRRATKLHDMFVDPGGGRREAAERLRSCGEHVDGPLVARYPSSPEDIEAFHCCFLLLYSSFLSFECSTITSTSKASCSLRCKASQSLIHSIEMRSLL